MIANAEHVLVVGATGAGKSTLVQEYLKDCTRCIAMTTKLTDYEKKDGWTEVRTLKELILTLRSKWSDKKLKICFRVPVGPDDMDQPIKVLHDVSNMLYKLQMPYAERRDDRQIGLVVDEAHRFFPHSRPKGMDGFIWTVSEGRDWGVNVLFATQRPTNIPPLFRDNVTNYVVLMLGGNTAVENVKSFVGASGGELKLPQKYGYSYYRSGQLMAHGDTRKPEITHKMP